MIEEPDWDLGRCRQLGVPTRAFFFEDHTVTNSPEYLAARRYARSICQECPIRTACATWAIEQNVEGGMWGGLTMAQRQRIRRRVYREALAALQDTLGSVHPPVGERLPRRL